MLSIILRFFFFSSRRRHTRLQGDWSSDVCSSDLPNLAIRTTNGRRYLQILKGGEAVDTDVVFGIANDTTTEVVSGVAEGDLAVLPAARATATARPGAGGGGFGGGPGVIVGR